MFGRKDGRASGRVSLGVVALSAASVVAVSAGVVSGAPTGGSGNPVEYDHAMIAPIAPITGDAATRIRRRFDHFRGIASSSTALGTLLWRIAWLTRTPPRRPGR